MLLFTKQTYSDGFHVFTVYLQHCPMNRRMASVRAWKSIYNFSENCRLPQGLEFRTILLSIYTLMRVMTIDVIS